MSVFLKRRRTKTHHLLHVHRSLSLGLVSIAFFATNCSAIEVVTMIALSARYGMLAVHFYWIGAIPALSFLLLVLLPRYQALGLTSVPEYLGVRFRPSTQMLSACSFTCLMVVLAGIALSLTSRILNLVFNTGLGTGVWTVAALVALFLLLGGVRGVIYAEALQLIIFLLVMAPLAIMTLRHTGGLFAHIALLPEWQRHTLGGLRLFSIHDRLDLTGTLAGLGVCLGFSYWCGDFILIQRLCSTRDGQMGQTPQFTLFAKLVMPLLLVLPGLGLERVAGLLSAGTSDIALPLLLRSQYLPFLATLAVCTLCASCFMGVCSYLIAAAGVYSRSLGPRIRHRLPLSDRELLVILCGSAAIAGTFTLHSRGLMETIQLAFSMLNLPVACVLLGGIFLRRMPGFSGTPSILAGTAAGLLHWKLATFFHYGSPLTQSFYGAIVSASGTLITMLTLTVLRPRHAPAPTYMQAATTAQSTAAMAGAAIVCMLLFYAIFF